MVTFRAWFLRTFRGRSRARAGWTETSPDAAAGPPRSFRLGDLEVAVQPMGERASGINQPSHLFAVRVGIPGDSRAWSSTYGLPPGATSSDAAEAALDELHQAWREPESWAAQVTAGMSEAEAEAMLDSPAMRLDMRASQWIGPHLDGFRASRDGTGRWLPEEPGRV